MPRTTRSQRTKNAQDNNNYNEPDTTNNNNLSSSNQADIYDSLLSEADSPPFNFATTFNVFLTSTDTLPDILPGVKQYIDVALEKQTLEIKTLFQHLQGLPLPFLICHKNPTISVTPAMFTVLITLPTQTMTIMIVTMNLALTSNKELLKEQQLTFKKKLLIAIMIPIIIIIIIIITRSLVFHKVSIILTLLHPSSMPRPCYEIVHKEIPHTLHSPFPNSKLCYLSPSLASLSK